MYHLAKVLFQIKHRNKKNKQAQRCNPTQNKNETTTKLDKIT